jgi:hypothetical protein
MVVKMSVLVFWVVTLCALTVYTNAASVCVYYCLLKEMLRTSTSLHLKTAGYILSSGFKYWKF